MEFSLEKSVLQLNGHTFSGWSDDSDALGFEAVELASVKRGADGKMVATSTGAKGGPVTLKLLPNSSSAKFMQSSASSVQKGTKIIWSGTFRDAENGVTAKLENGILTKYPPLPTLGKGSVGNMEYVIEFETIEPDYTAASF